MPKPSEKLMDLEADRLKIIHDQQKALRKRLSREQKNVKKAGGGFLAGDEARKKDLAILWKLANPHMSFTDIANQIGEHKTVVKRWFREDADVQEKYLFFTTHFTEAALELIETYTLEATLTLVTLMRFGSEKYMYESANSLLDRGGAPKRSATEVDSHKTVEHTWEDQTALKDQIRALPEELQEDAVKALEQLEEMLTQSANGKLVAAEEAPKEEIEGNDG